MKKIYLLLALLILLVSCYQDTVDTLSSFKIQIPIYFHSDSFDKAIPDTSSDFSNLNEYETYRDNKDRVKRAEVYQFNYWIDSLILENGQPYNPDEDSLVIDKLTFYLVFAQPLTPDLNSTNPDDFMPDPMGKKYVLGEYENVNINQYWRNPEHIIDVPDDVALTISTTLKEKPYFYIITETGTINGQPQMEFPFIRSRFDLIVRLDVEL